MNENGKVIIGIQEVPGINIDDKLIEIEEVLKNTLNNEMVRKKIQNPDKAISLELDKNFVAEGIAVTVTFWFLEKVAGKVFEEYIWPALKKKIDGLIRE